MASSRFVLPWAFSPEDHVAVRVKGRPLGTIVSKVLQLQLKDLHRTPCNARPGTPHRLRGGSSFRRMVQTSPLTVTSPAWMRSLPRRPVDTRLANFSRS